MYSCSTAKPGTWVKVLVVAMFAAGAGLFLTGYLVQSYRGAFQCAGAVAAVAAEIGYISQSDISRLIAFRNDPSDGSWAGKA